MPDQFIDEPISPVPGTFDVRGMSRGAPGLPQRFRWRGAEYAVAAVLETWKTTGPCDSGSDEQYVRKHWFRIRTTDGAEMRLYFEHHARSARQAHVRWWLYTVS